MNQDEPKQPRAPYTVLYDSAIRGLKSLRDGYVLCLVFRHCQMRNRVFSAGIQNKAADLGINHKQLRAALHSLTEQGYTQDLTPDAKNRPHNYIVTPKGMALLTCDGQYSLLQNSKSTLPNGESTLPNGESEGLPNREGSLPVGEGGSTQWVDEDYKEDNHLGKQEVVVQEREGRTLSLTAAAVEIWSKSAGVKAKPTQVEMLSELVTCLNGDFDLELWQETIRSALVGGLRNPANLDALISTYWWGNGSYERWMELRASTDNGRDQEFLEVRAGKRHWTTHT